MSAYITFKFLMKFQPEMGKLAKLSLPTWRKGEIYESHNSCAASYVPHHQHSTPSR